MVYIRYCVVVVSATIGKKLEIKISCFGVVYLNSKLVTMINSTILRFGYTFRISKCVGFVYKCC